MSYFRRPNPKSNWKRPKPKIYDCNARDLENFYQKSYSEYLSAKNDRQARDLDRDRRGDAEELTRRFEQRRASSLVYGEDDSPRAHRLIPNRQTSNDGTNEHSFLRSRLESSLEGGSGDTYRAGESRSSTSSSRHVTFNSTLNAPDSNSEMASIETRLERLRKLREDLGLPAEVNGTSSSYANASSLTTSTSESESRGRESSRWTKSGSVTRSDSRSRGSPTRGIQESTSSSSYSKTERTSNLLRNGTDDTSSGYKPRASRNVSNQEEQSSYSSRSSRNASGIGEQGSSYSSKSNYSTGGDSNGYKDSYESTSTSRRTRRVEKPTLDGIDLDDDALLSDVKKKFPSSSEILERIKNMDID